MISFEDARARLIASVKALGPELVPIAQARGRVLAESLSARRDVPAVDASVMDGYAVRAADFTGRDLPLALPVSGESRAGGLAPLFVHGTTCRIFTGAPMPEGADAVEMQENVTRDGETAVFSRALPAGTFVRHQGDDLRAGVVALDAGVTLGPATLALAAVLDRGTLLVARKPRVVLLSTGDELRAPGSAAAPGTIPDSNTLAIAALAEGAGADVVIAPYAPDDAAATAKAIDVALRATDVLVTIGGASVGDHDHVRPALETCGVKVDFWRVALKPGKPMLVGTRGDAIVLGLPGNPVSAMVTFALFGVPLLRALQGDRAPVAPYQRARLSADVTREAGRFEFARARLSVQAGELRVTPLSNQASGAVAALAASDALAIYPPEASTLKAGTMIDVVSLEALGLA